MLSRYFKIFSRPFQHHSSACFVSVSVALAQDGDVVEIEARAKVKWVTSPGKIVVSFQGDDTRPGRHCVTLTSRMHAGVECVVELKPGEGYRNGFAPSSPLANRKPLMSTAMSWPTWSMTRFSST